MLFQYLLTASFAVLTAVLVVRVSTTPEARLRYLGQSAAVKLSDVAHEIHFPPSFDVVISELAANLEQPTVTFHPRASSSQRYIVGVSPVMPKPLIKLLDHLNHISASWVESSRKIRNFFRPSRFPWPRVRYWIRTILPPEAILALASDLWLPHFGSLVLYIWRTALKLRLHLRWLLLWRHSQKWAMVLVVATDTVTDEAALMKQGSEAHHDYEDLPQILSAPVSETAPLQILSQILPADGSEVLSINELVRSQLSQALETVLAAPATHNNSDNKTISPSDPMPPLILEKSIPLHLHFRRHLRNLVIAHGPMNADDPATDETTLTKEEVPGSPSDSDSELPPLRPRRKRTRSYSRLRRHQREVLAHLTQPVKQGD